MSDTPRTDSYVAVLIAKGADADSLEHFTRDLERELNAAKARIARLEEALNECDHGFTKHCPDEWSTNGASWKAIRDALGRPNPWEHWTP